MSTCQLPPSLAKITNIQTPQPQKLEPIVLPHPVPILYVSFCVQHEPPINWHKCKCLGVAGTCANDVPTVKPASSRPVKLSLVMKQPSQETVTRRHGSHRDSVIIRKLFSRRSSMLWSVCRNPTQCHLSVYMFGVYHMLKWFIWQWSGSHSIYFLPDFVI